MALDAKKYLHSDEMHEDDSVFDPGGKQEYTEEQLIRFAEMWAIIKLKENLMKKCECGKTSNLEGFCDGTHTKIKSTLTKVKEAVCKGVCKISGNTIRFGWCETKCC
tara:strand:+ start:2296 stop:2616 length:321 start_codon:yes stop_codon:yes gene_type:complete